MKHIKLFEQFINENVSFNMLKKALPGIKFTEQEIEFDEEEYDSVNSFSTKVAGLDDEIYINIYDGKNFCFFYDSTPIGTSAHSKSDADKMARTQIEVPIPLNKLNASLFNEVISSSINEGIESFGRKTKKFIDKIVEYDLFTDANSGEDTLPNEYQKALKTLNIKANDAIICFFDAVGDAREVRDEATKAGLKFVEVLGDEDDDIGSGGIVFSYKQ